MHTNAFLKRLRDLFAREEGASGGNQTGSSSAVSAPPHSADRGDRQAADVHDLVARLEGNGVTEVMAGCIQILGLDAIKERLGSRWSELAGRSIEIAQQALDEHLAPGDIYRLIDDSSFQICFESSDEAHARLQVSRISEEVERRIAAELQGSGLRLEGFVAPVPCARIRDSKDPLSSLYSSLLEIRAAVNSGAVRRRSIPALLHAGALFQPLWSNRDFGITKNRCLLDTLAGAAATKYLEEIEDLEDLVAALANLDCFVFAKSVEALHQALGDIKRATIVIPVHFQTLATEQQEFLDIAATLPPPYRRLVLLDLIGVPMAATSKDLLKALKVGRTITDRMVLQMSPTDHRMDQAVRNIIWGLSMTAGELDSDDPQVVQDLVRFAQVASEYGLHSFAYGANTIGKAIAIAAAGFDYICGTAVAPTTSVPKPHARFKPLFGEVTAPADEHKRKVGLREYARFAPVDPNSSLTLLNGKRHPCRVPIVSASGAEVLCPIKVQEQDYLVLGSIPAQVVRMTKHGFAVRFLEVQQHSAIEIALQTPSSNEKLLRNLRTLGA